MSNACDFDDNPHSYDTPTIERGQTVTIMRDEEVTLTDVKGAWVAYYLDYSEMVPFATEVEALRHAVANGMQVLCLAYGKGLREATR